MATLYASQIQQHERALGGWQAEWETLPELITLVGGALAQSEALVRDMQVFPQKMRADLDITHGLIMAEAVTLALAAFIGKAEAHHRIEALCRQALDESARWSICSRTTRRSASISSRRLTSCWTRQRRPAAPNVCAPGVARYQEQRDES
jgi:3-carboxy-cis,cis-muconate cycloisomerase